MSIETGLGMQAVLRINTSPDHPFSFAETPGGLLLLANGIDPMLKWDGLSAAASTAGVKPPAVAVELGGTGLGYIAGKLVAYSRFIDADGNPSDLSPVSNLVDCGRDGFIQDINYVSSVGQPIVRSRGHGLATGDVLAIDGVLGIPTVNGQWTVTVIDEDNFGIVGLVVTSGFYVGGGVWTMGIKTILYGAVPVPVEAKVARRQILRNLSGIADTLYVDIDTEDLVTTAFASQATDAILATGIAVPLTFGDDDLPFANRNGVPPSHKSVIASHKGRIYATADASYSVGHVEPVFNSTQVQGVQTVWRSTLVGRVMYISGATTFYEIVGVDEGNQVITLGSPYRDKPVPYALYVIRPDSAERRLVYYSEPGLAESWPAYNALAIPETNDDIIGLLSLGQYLYILERRNIHRLTFQGDPQDGYTFLSATRGSLNDRTYAVADGATYFLDEIGIHKFDGQQSHPISLPIQNLFQSDGSSDYRVDWVADQSFWHAAHDPIRDTIRWFVNMVGYSDLWFAISYNYRTDRWWLEQYPNSISASTNATFGGRRSLAGTDARRVLCLGEGAYDGVDGTGTLYGTATASDSDSLTDSTASFGAVESAPITIVDGTGVGQTRVIAAVTATSVTIVEPWDTVPDTTSVYQIGGIPWRWRSGWFRFINAEEDTARDAEIVFAPTTLPSWLSMYLYFDQSVTPRAWSRSINQDGVRTTEGDPRITVNLNTEVGWARQRISGHSGTYSYGDTFVSVEMRGCQSGEPVRVSQVVLNDIEV